MYLRVPQAGINTLFTILSYDLLHVAYRYVPPHAVHSTYWGQRIVYLLNFTFPVINIRKCGNHLKLTNCNCPT